MANFIKFDSIRNWHDFNIEYVSKNESLLDAYFNPSKMGKKGYVHIGPYKTEDAKRFTTRSKSQKVILEPIKITGKYPAGFDGYEKVLYSHIFFGSMDTYVVSGPMGSGKTTSVRYVIEKGCEMFDSEKKPVDIYLDFNLGFGSKKVADLVEEFCIKLYAMLKVEIIENISRFKLTTEFLNYIKKNNRKYFDFYDFSFAQLYQEYGQWTKFDEKEKIWYLFQFIEKYTTKIDIRLDMTMQFIGFLNEYLKKRDILLIIIYDNIDKLVPVAQHNILSKIMVLNNIAKTKKIIPIRRSTKAKFDKIIRRSQKRLHRNRAQIVYGHIYHHGPSPIRIYKTRLKELIKDVDDLPFFDSLSKDEKQAVKLRAKSVLHFFSQKKGFLTPTFNCLSGESIRLGLTIGNRPFANYFGPYDSEPLNQQQLIQGFLVGDDPSLRMSPDDEYVANLLACDQTYQFSLINYYLLSMVMQAGHFKNVSDKSYRYSSFIYDVLTKAFKYSDDEVISAFNFLMDAPRALIGGEYRPGYEDSDELLRLDDKIRITEIGERYYEGLLMKNTRYLQECFLSLKWENAQVYEYSIAGRFHALRSSLYSIHDEEAYRLNNFHYYISHSEKYPFKFIKMERHLLLHFAKSLVFATQQMDNLSFNIQKEIEAWIDYLREKDWNDKFGAIISDLNAILNRSGASSF